MIQGTWPLGAKTIALTLNGSAVSEEILSLCTDAILGGYTIEQYSCPDELVPWSAEYIADLYYSVYDKALASDGIYRAIYEDLYVSGYEKPKTVGRIN